MKFFLLGAKVWPMNSGAFGMLVGFGVYVSFSNFVGIWTHFHWNVKINTPSRAAVQANEGSNAAAGSRSKEGNRLGKGIRIRVHWMLV